MSELKFTCPGCGQHMQCEKAYSGDKINCPSCQAELRVPFSDTPPEPSTMLPRAEMVSVAESAKAQVRTKASKPSLTDASVPIAPSPLARTHAPEPTVSHHTQEAHCICPVCKSELRIPTGEHDSPVIAEVVNGPKTATGPTTSAHSGDTESITEREKHIVAARESNPVRLYPAMKPRLDFIKTGGEAPAGHGENPKKPSGNEEPPPPFQTVTE